MSVLQKLQFKEDWTPVEQVIADFILAHREWVIDASIAQLAQEVNASNAAIIRLCQKLELSGFKALKIALVKETERRRNQHDPIDIDYPLDLHEQTQDVLKKIASLTIESVNSTYEVLETASIEQAAKLLFDARMIYFYAVGDTLMNAMGFSNRLLKLMKDSILMTQYGETLAHIRNIRPEDVFVLISYSGRTTIPDKILRQIKQSKAKLIHITSASPIPGFDITLRIPPRESVSQKQSTYYSQISIHYIFNCLYALMYTKATKQSVEMAFFDEH